MKKILALLLASLLVISLFAGCAKQTNDTMKKDEQPAANGETAKENMGEKTDEMPMDAEKPTITFVHGYYHDESEWPAAAQMRQIYQDFADMHKDEFTFVAIPDESGAEGIYNTALNDISGGKFYDIADFGGWNIVPVASAAGLILDLKPYLDGDAGFKAGAGVCYDQNLTADGKIYSVREQIEAVGFWYNEALFVQAGAKVPADWSTWADFEEAVDKLVDAGITPFGLNAGWPTNILTAGRFQADEATRAFYAQGAEVASFDDPAFREVMTFMQEKVLQKIDSANFGPGGDDDEQYRNALQRRLGCRRKRRLCGGRGEHQACELPDERIRQARFPDVRRHGLCGIEQPDRSADRSLHRVHQVYDERRNRQQDHRVWHRHGPEYQRGLYHADGQR